MPNKNGEEKDFTENESLPALFVDAIRVAPREDGVLLVQFGAQLPSGPKEQVRIMIHASFTKRMIDVFCKSCNYFPEDPDAATKKAPKKKSRKVLSKESFENLS